MSILEAMRAGLEHHRAGRLGEAEGIYRRVLEILPGNPDALHLLGMVEEARGNDAKAIELIEGAIAGQAGRGEFHSNLSLVLLKVGRIAEAAAAARKAMELQPRLVEAYGNLAQAMLLMGDPAGAAEVCRRAAAMNPDDAGRHDALGRMLCEAGRVEEGILSFERAIALEPGRAEAHWNRGLALLMMGDYARGWEEYEWRWKMASWPNVRPRIARPMWDGGEVTGKRVLVWEEQGFGDAIQFVRYAPLLAERGAAVVVMCDRPLERLLRSVGVEVVSSKTPPGDFDLHCPMASLPGLFGTRVETIPRRVPYLKAEASAVEKWRGRMGEGGGLRVGICWAGNAEHAAMRHRHVALEMLAPLGRAAGGVFYSLKKREAVEVFNVPAGMTVVDFGDELADFAETAAVVANLDLVISVDTAVAHLAGAMGKRVWTMLPFLADWRWMRGREDSPWYPTMKLFRQEKVGDWTGVVERVGVELEKVARGEG